MTIGESHEMCGGELCIYDPSPIYSKSGSDFLLQPSGFQILTSC